MDYIRKEYSLSLAPQTRTRRVMPEKRLKINVTPTETRLITPEDRIKFQIENQLDMSGLNVPAGKPMQELTDAIFKAVFNSDTAASIRDVMFEIREQEKLTEATNDD